MGTKAHTQVHVWRRDLQFSKEDRPHLIIVMLAGVHQHLCMACRSQLSAHWRGFDELRPGADYGDNLRLS